ncbi:mucin-2 [Anabrus simplex]|uniref:mucin-2 n=1 Tax=Anabrus simplex TaxID=316456 RepID=UPI0035A35E12
MDIQHKISLLAILVGGCAFSGVKASAPSYCKSPGMMCDTTLREVGLCTGDGNSWERLGECESGSCVCGGGLCKCSEENMLHQPRFPAVTCDKVGMYPDPLDCGKSVFCTTPGEPAVACRTCPGTEIYDACTGECKPNGKCSAPILCKNIGVQGAVSGNEWLFYYCLPNRLIMSYCDLKPFNPKDHACNSEDEPLCVLPSADIDICNQSSSTTIGTTSSLPTSMTPSETTSPPSTSMTPYETTSHPPTSMTPSATTSPAPTSMTPSATTSPPPTSMTPSATTSPPPTSLTPPKTTSTPPIICTHFGPVKDPVNCHGFYFCDITLVPHPINCWPGYWYDDNAKQCVEGECMSLYS